MKFNENLNAQFKQFAELQAKSFEPARVFAEVAADMTEQVLRKNYDVLGDMVEFAVKQTQIPTSSKDLNEVISNQVSEVNAFAETMSSRANEYLEMTTAMGQQAKKAADEAVAAVKAA